MTVGSDSGGVVGNGRGGVLVIRVWLEESSTEPVRARVRSTVGVPPGAERVQPLAGTDAILEAVHAWLAEVCAPPVEQY